MKRFIIKMNHESLKYLLEQKITTPLQQNGMLKLMRLNYVIHYQNRKQNKAVDALSRRDLKEGTTLLVSIVVPT